MDEIISVVDFQVDDRPRSICAFIERIAPILQENERRPWHLDLSSSTYIGPDAAAIMVVSVMEARRLGQMPRVTLPVNPIQLVAFCEFSGLMHYVEGMPFPTTDPEGTATPIQILTQSSFNDPDPTIRLIRRNVNLSDEAEELLSICINEIVQNVQDHAGSTVGCAMCARFMKGSNEIRVAIVDRGFGISTTLRRRHSELPNAQIALERVVEGGYSAKSRSNNMGVGISNLCAIVVNQLGGEIFIISEDGFADAKAGRSLISRTLAVRYPGTAVFFTLPVGKMPREDQACPAT